MMALGLVPPRQAIAEVEKDVVGVFVESKRGGGGRW